MLANVVDDRDMRITHVIRGEDLLPDDARRGCCCGGARRAASEAASCRLRPPADAGERTAPEAVQAPGHGGRRVLPRRGYLAEPSATTWPCSAGARPEEPGEARPSRRWSSEFRLEDVNHAPAFFDVKKLAVMNGEYIRALSVDDFIDGLPDPWLARRPACRGRRSGSTRPCSAPWPRSSRSASRVLGEVPAMVDFLFLDEPLDRRGRVEIGGRATTTAPAILAAALAAYASCRLDGGVAAQRHRPWPTVGRKLSKAQAPIRVAVTGRRVGPPLFESLEVLGREAVLERLRVGRAARGRPAEPVRRRLAG